MLISLASSVNITAQGRPVLGSPVGNSEFISIELCQHKSSGVD